MSNDDQIENQLLSGKVLKIGDEQKANHTRSEELKQDKKQTSTEININSSPITQEKLIGFQFHLYDEQEQAYNLQFDNELNKYHEQKLPSNITLQKLQNDLQVQLSPKFQYASIYEIVGSFQAKNQEIFVNDLSDDQKKDIAISNFIDGPVCKVFLYVQKKQLQEDN